MESRQATFHIVSNQVKQRVTLSDDLTERSSSLAYAQPFTFTTKVGKFTVGFGHTVTHTVEHRLLQFAGRILEQ